jgi:hypothetical protein
MDNIRNKPDEIAWIGLPRVITEMGVGHECVKLFGSMTVIAIAIDE